MNNNSFIFLQTLQHTGTWFLIQFLLAHPQISGFSEFWPLNPWDLEKEFKAYPDKALKKAGLSLEKNKKSLIHQHFTSEEAGLSYYMVNNAVALIQPGVVPIRDPLLALISHERRAKISGDLDRLRNIKNPDSILIAWDRVIHLDKVFRGAGLESFFFFPLDLLTASDTYSREIWLGEVLETYYLNRDIDLCQKWAEDWPIINSTRSAFKKTYALGDKELMESEQPVIIKSLQKREKNWRGFFEELGYKNLLWWS